MKGFASSAPQNQFHTGTVEASVGSKCTVKKAQICSLMEAVRAEVPEFGRPQSLAYPVPGLVCLRVIAAAQGVTRGPQDLADYAETLSQGQLRALEFRFHVGTTTVRYPGKTTFDRILKGIDNALVERVLVQWMNQLLGRAASIR